MCYISKNFKSRYLLNYFIYGLYSYILFYNAGYFVKMDANEKPMVIDKSNPNSTNKQQIVQHNDEQLSCQHTPIIIDTTFDRSMNPEWCIYESRIHDLEVTLDDIRRCLCESQSMQQQMSRDIVS